MLENKNDFTQGSIASKLIKFMVPILGALVLQAMYGAVFKRLCTGGGCNGNPV